MRFSSMIWFFCAKRRPGRAAHPARRVRDAIKKIRDGFRPALVQRVALPGRTARDRRRRSSPLAPGLWQFVFDFKVRRLTRAGLR